MRQVRRLLLPDDVLELPQDALAILFIHIMLFQVRPIFEAVPILLPQIFIEPFAFRHVSQEIRSQGDLDAGHEVDQPSVTGKQTTFVQELQD
jgi:hypothetical protein